MPCMLYLAVNDVRVIYTPTKPVQAILGALLKALFLAQK